MPAGPQRRSLRRFLAWWGAELRALLPAGLRPRPLPPDAVVLQAGAEDAGSLSAALRRRGKEWPLGTLSNIALRPRDRGLPVHLRLTEGSVLHRRLTLPLDAEDSLREAIAFQIDGLTPFKREEICFGFRIVERDAPSGMLSLVLAAVPRQQLAPSLEAARSRGLAIAAAETAGEGQAIIIPLNDDNVAARKNKGAQRLFVVLALAAIVLAAVAVALPLHQREQRRSLLEERVEAARVEALAAQRLRDRLAALAAGGRFFAERKRPGHLAIDALKEVTRLLPDGAWLTGFILTETEVTLSGYATNASGLVVLLEDSPLFENARFRSPVTREGQQGLERFELSSDVVAADLP
ncbi:PilN domain-containing protein [Pelagibius sp. 7325]|uniref:PilN domain-containing protein n=1 Tax=Pelagibius sp. 7325 TaxID=3131994 RepID=UPI0030EF1274